MKYTKNIIQFYFLVILISGGALTVELHALLLYTLHGIPSNNAIIPTQIIWWWVQALPFLALLILGIIFLKRFFRLWIAFCSLYVLLGQFEAMTYGINKLYLAIASTLFLIASIYAFYRYILDKNIQNKSLENGAKNITVPRVVIWILLLFLVLPLISILFSLLYH